MDNQTSDINTSSSAKKEQQRTYTYAEMQQTINQKRKYKELLEAERTKYKSLIEQHNAKALTKKFGEAVDINKVKALKSAGLSDDQIKLALGVNQTQKQPEAVKNDKGTAPGKSSTNTAPTLNKAPAGQLEMIGNDGKVKVYSDGKWVDKT